MKTFLFPVFVSIITGISGILCLQNVSAQTVPKYIAPQDTIVKKRTPDESLNSYHYTTQTAAPDARTIAAAMKAAEILSDTLRYNPQEGVSIEQLFKTDDLEYFSKQGLNSFVALFELVNKYLPKGKSISFKTTPEADVTIAENPLVLKDLRVIITANPAVLNTNRARWQENVYQAYIARDYGTKLHNTITITSATREIRETPELELIDFNGSPITLSEILQKESAKTTDKNKAERSAVKEFRIRTFPSELISIENANENYRRALLTLIRLQEDDINRHPKSKAFVERLTSDLKNGENSNVLKALKASSFFNVNVPGNPGPVLLTENAVIDPEEIVNNAEAKAMELIMLSALHYGERDAIKLLTRLAEGEGSLPASKTNDFSPERLGELTDHGVEKLKSLGFGTDKTSNMTSADLVLVAVAAPETPATAKPKAFLTLQQIGSKIMNYYNITEIRETKNMVLLNPRISAGSRHTEYRAAYDAVDFVPELTNGVSINQEGSRIVQNGIEIRLESDLYFSNLKKISDLGVKPLIYPQFGIIAGSGTRKVGYDNNTITGPHGAVPKFRQDYINWGGHIGLNIGPVLLGVDATVLSTPEGDDPYKRFFDLSGAMTYYRYSFIAHIINLGIGQSDPAKAFNMTLDLELSGETNNEWTINKTRTQSGTSQTGSGEWKRDYERAHPNGQYDHLIATEMIKNGDVKAAYAASNYAALHGGIEKSGFHLEASIGLYNLRAIDGHDESAGEWAGRLFRNTLKGNLFGALKLTYNFNSGRWYETHKRTETYQSDNSGYRSSPKIEESSGSGKSASWIRDRAVFTNTEKRTR